MVVQMQLHNSIPSNFFFLDLILLNRFQKNIVKFSIYPTSKTQKHWLDF